MKNAADRLIELWTKLSADLQLEIVAPYQLKIGVHINISVPVLLRNFGGRAGILILDSYQKIENNANEIYLAGYGYSVYNISESELSRYNAESFISDLIDWSWTGPDDKQPKWMLREINQQNSAILQSKNSKNICIEFDRLLADAGAFGQKFYQINVDRAVQIAEHFTNVHWQYIAGFWKNRSSNWQSCLADCLRDLQPPVAEDWLLHMMESPDDNLASSALENFRNLQRDRIEKRAVPKNLIPHIRELWRRRFNFTENQLEQILDDLASGADARK